jgi:hypothetical protein
MIKMLVEMQPVCEFAKVEFELLMSDVSHEDVKVAFDWLTDFYKQEYGAVKKIWKLLPVSVWYRYKMMGTDDLREMIMLTEACKSFRRAAKGCPKILKKGNYEKQ